MSAAESLRQRVRVVCVEQDLQMQDFISEPIREHLHRRSPATPTK